MTTPATPTLFSPLTFGPYQLKNRIAMAPLTRSRALPGDIPGPLAVEYYRQRASAGLIIAEATQISPQGKGYVSTPGIYNQEQVAGWQKVTAAVHEKGGRIVLQLWHVGRISHPDLQENGALPVAPSAITPAGTAYTKDGFVPLVTPRALELAELPGIVAQYKLAAELAKEAGFDGVEIHAANGYLLDQFLRTSTNQRQDAYGGSIENRARLLVEVCAAVCGVWGGDKVGIRLSPFSPFNDIADADPVATFGYVIAQLNSFGMLYLHMIEGATGGAREVTQVAGFDWQNFRQKFKGVYIANNGYEREMALDAVASGKADMIAFGRLYIANPDLPHRLELNAPLNPLDPKTLYGGDDRGYTDYPFLPQAA